MAEAEGSLPSVISAAIAANDPLDPWLVVSNYDEHYWDDLAKQVAPIVAKARVEQDVFAALAGMLKQFVAVAVSDDDPYARDRIAASTATIWGWMQREAGATS